MVNKLFLCNKVGGGGNSGGNLALTSKLQYLEFCTFGAQLNQNV